ncbi:ABC transporter ATP-binding protein [Streptococcus minor]|uniref:ABC transporter ATP-binding protein n=1 Tax=Streptococcus minor TaxID=229549 RepID=A0A3P1VFQ1_9STRE|nr:ABC transporter ATP-binding protein [Streptococcus minor]MDO5079276.1 ABC transporter ATP-binding protein [Streptococcus minor]RRD32486.1 ABC transporter ATP-binding protein [Streptococcus minor]
MDMPSNLVEIQQVSKSYSSLVALNNINLRLGAGKIIGLLGPNGSGKTTLIKLLNGLLQPDYGQILIKGHTPSPETKNIISYLPDTTYLDENMKVSQAIEFFSDFYADFDHRRALHLLEDLHIDPNSRMRHLSKGNKEKVQLILVMCRQAQLYILDEPIGGVDPAARDYILKTIINNYSPTASVIISTHLISDVEHILDEVIFLQNGSVVRHGNVDDLRIESGLSIDELFRNDFRA